MGQVPVNVKVTTNLNLQRPPKSEPLSTPVEDYRRILCGAGLLAGLNDLLSEACVDLLFENSGMTAATLNRERDYLVDDSLTPIDVTRNVAEALVFKRRPGAFKGGEK